MSDFKVIDVSPESLRIELGQHSLDGEAQDLFRFVQPVVEAGHHREITLVGEDADRVSLEGVAVLMRLLKRAIEADVRFVLVMPHPVVERKLELTGVLDILTNPSKGSTSSRSGSSS
jgi:anti-anti-sigma regulatory factor